MSACCTSETGGVGAESHFPTKISENLIDHLWVGWGGNSSFCTCSFSPSSPSLTTSSVGGGVTALASEGLGACPLPRRRPPTTSSTASCRYSSSSYSPSGWFRRTLSRRCWCWRGCCSSSNHLRNRVNMVRYQFVSPRYQLDPSNSTKQRMKEWNFPKVL